MSISICQGNDEADLYEKDESQYPQELTTAFTRYFEGMRGKITFILYSKH